MSTEAKWITDNDWSPPISIRLNEGNDTNARKLIGLGEAYFQDQLPSPKNGGVTGLMFLEIVVNKLDVFVRMQGTRAEIVIGKNILPENNPKRFPGWAIFFYQGTRQYFDGIWLQTMTVKKAADKE